MSAAHLRAPAVWVRNTPNCSTKVVHWTEKEARVAVKKIGVGSVYRCPHCSRWHLTTGRTLPAGVRADS
jgi:DNA-directed RNA polymerase subunit RPC12/RpoP